MLQSKLFRLAIFIPLAILFLSNQGNPPNGRTGAPGDGLCSDCHSGGGGFSGTVDISGVPGTIMPLTAYPITVSVNKTGGGEHGGMQMVVLNSSNQNFGTLTSAGPSSTLTPSGGRTYFEHNPAIAFSGNTVSYTVTWNSPASGSGTISFYAAGVISNDNNNTGGDLVLTDVQSGDMIFTGPSVKVSISSTTNVSCKGGSDGAATATAMDGQPPYSFAWNNGMMDATISGVTAGAYVVTVTDNVGGTASAQAIITEPSLPVKVTETSNIGNNCFGASTGSSTVNATGGNGGFTYFWSTGNTGNKLSNAAAGTYTVVATDSKGCTGELAISIADGVQILVTDDVQQPNCTKPLARVELKFRNGKPKYKVTWPGKNQISVDSVAIFTDIAPGNYTYSVIDANSCFITDNIEVIKPDTSKPKLQIADQNAYLDTSGNYNIAISNLIHTKSDNCDTSLTIQFSTTSFNCSQIGSRRIFATAIDDFANQSNDTFDLMILDTLKPNVVSWKDTVLYACNIKVPQLQISDNCGIKETKRISGLIDGSIFPIGKTTQEYEIVDNNNNVQKTKYTVEVKKPFTLDSITWDSVYCYDKITTLKFKLQHALGDSIFIQTNTGDTSWYQHNTWLSFAFDSLDAFNITLADKFSACFDTTRYMFNIQDILFESSITDASASNRSDGIIELLNLKGSGPLTVKWYNEAGNEIGLGLVLNAIPPGKYYAIIIDVYGCEKRSVDFIVKFVTANTNPIPLSSWRVFPNPTTNTCFLQHSSSGNVQIQLFSIVGELVYNKLHTEQLISINTSDLTEGIYVYVIQSIEGVKTGSILISKE